ncbi:MAG: DUF167 domain-containing protein [Candidatus Accumulibacter sp.]|uniref:DUF167 domain-containing protein n=1 Tax=Accumulibacter sp. TaxID=2053492 RepID=UPI0019E34D9E|nr:DUF167 domain-containing protein [Accumulibacter sp.]MBE2258575.1 DUF167 domain-containing protein [Paracoccaceae bacterium]MCB1941086.1 DUF167 domain-containing protein [Accumulibacter sp.]MCP5248223.1 DUF167 domain-containing protein [Accumulibacter sp.]
MLDWWRVDGGSLALVVHVQPGAKQTEVAGLHGGALKIRLAAPAIDGRANTALVDYVARRLGVPRAAVELRSGQKSRRKRLLVTGAPAGAARLLLGG